MITTNKELEIGKCYTCTDPQWKLHFGKIFTIERRRPFLSGRVCYYGSVDGDPDTANTIIHHEMVPFMEEVETQKLDEEEPKTNSWGVRGIEIKIGDRIQVIANPIGGTSKKFANRIGSIYRLCSKVFPDFVYVEFDLGPKEKVKKVQMMEKKHLFLIEESIKNSNPETMKKETAEVLEQIQLIRLADICENPLNPRKHFDSKAISELAASISEKGVLSPILVRPVMDSMPQKYEVVCGARRFRASIEAGQKTIPSMVRVLDDEEALELMIIENLQRKDVNPMEEAAAIHSMMERYKDYSEVASRLGKSSKFAAERDKLNNLIEGFQKALFQGSLLVKTANELAKISKDSQQLIFDEAVLNNGSETITWKGYITGDTILNMIKNRATASLANPPFDPEDTALTKAPACSSCQFNSDNQPLLFDDGGPTCLNSVCFGLKKQISFQNKLRDAAESGALMIKTSYGDADKETKKTVADLGASILKDGEFSEFRSKIQKPGRLLDFEEFRKSWLKDNPDDEVSEDGWFRIKYKGYVKRKQEEVEAYEKDLRLEEEGALIEGYVKAFVVEGYNDKGMIKLIKPKSAVKATAGGAGAEILEQIEKIEAREARAKELDREKIYGQATPLLGKEWTLDTAELTQLEQIATVIALSHQFYLLRDRLKDMLGLNDWDYGLMQLYNALMEAPEKVEAVLNLCLRFTIPNCLIDASTLDYEKSGRPKVIMDLVRARNEKELAEIELNQQGIALARQERVDKKLADLRAELETVKRGGKNE